MSILKIRDENGNIIEIPAIKGEDGKSAYDYAKEGGYTGTEAQFMAKMAEVISLSKLGVTASAIELNYMEGVTSAVQTQLNNKAPAYTYSSTNLTAGSSSLATGKLYFVYE